MQKWMEGYVSDIDYTLNYYRMLDPEYINSCLVSYDIKPIDIDEEFTYCELGCGYGLSLLFFAAMYPQGKFYGVDYNPTHIAYINNIVKKVGLKNIFFYEKSFQDVVDEPSLLPNFDFIVFHGIYAWVNDNNRDNLVKICYQHLKPGGVVYNSYNTKPGWLVAEVIQKMIINFSKEFVGDSIEKIKKVIDLLEELESSNIGFFKVYKAMFDSKFKNIKSSNEHYVVHEYLNEEWKALYFPEVAQKMKEVKLDYVGIAELSNAYLRHIIPKDMAKYLSEIKDDTNYEFLKDLFVIKAFRKDLYVRGISNKLNKYEKYKYFLNKKAIYIKNVIPDEFNFKIDVGKLEGDKRIYKSICEELNYTPQTLYELAKKLNISNEEMMQASILLFDNNYIGFYTKTNQKIFELNRYIVENTLFEKGISYLIYPNCNCVNKFDKVFLVFLDALNKGIKEKEKIIDYAKRNLMLNGFTLLDDNNNPIKDDKKLDKKIREYIIKWEKDILPIWKKVGIVTKKTLR